MKAIHDVLKNTLPDISNRFVKINEGGCGVFALHLSRALRHQGQRCSVVLVDGWYREKDITSSLKKYNLKSINTLWKGAGVKYPVEELRIGHLVVRVDGRLYDCRGDVSYRYSAISKPILDWPLYKVVKNANIWNNEFWLCNGDVFTSMGKLVRKLIKR